MSEYIVLLDLGNVLYHYQPVARLNSLGYFTGLSPSEVQAALVDSDLVARLDNGTASEGDLVAFLSKLASCALTAPECWHFWFKVFTPNTGLWNQLPALAQVFRLGVLSNNPGAMRMLLGDSFAAQDIFLSGELRATKPSADIFSEVELSLGLSADAICLVDDSAANLDAAAARGWRTLQYLYDPYRPVALLAPQLCEVFGC